MIAKSLHSTSEFHILESNNAKHLFVVNGSKFYDLPATINLKDKQYDNFLNSIKDDFITDKYIGTKPLTPPKLSSLSLNVAQGCNLSCTYCYADEGKFLKHSRLMKTEIAFKSIDRLFSESEKNSTVTIGFMGGEPLLNRKLLHDSTNYATEIANKRNQKVKFSLTTNGTLLTEEDVRLFKEHPFTVAISLGGPSHIHDSQRKTHKGKGSYNLTSKKLELFNTIGRPKHLSARATITPKNINLLESLDHLINLGFDDVGFSPVLVSPNPKLTFDEKDFDTFLYEMIKCGEKAVSKLIKGEKYPFSNLETALFEIHRGSHRPYSCGAGAGYMSVNAEGDLYACHRLIDDKQFFMGDIENGMLDFPRQELLKNTFVDTIEPCKSCWARYLCGGGCHHEVKHRGRVGCDYIRGWLTFCLSAYSEILDKNPSYFNQKDIKYYE